MSLPKGKKEEGRETDEHKRESKHKSTLQLQRGGRRQLECRLDTIKREREKVVPDTAQATGRDKLENQNWEKI